MVSSATRRKPQTSPRRDGFFQMATPTTKTTGRFHRAQSPGERRGIAAQTDTAEAVAPALNATTAESATTTKAKGTEVVPTAAIPSPAPIIPMDLVARLRTSRAHAKNAGIAFIAALVAYGNDLSEVRSLLFPHGTWLPALEQAGIPEKEARWAMDIAKNPVTSNPSNWPDLPSAVSAIHEVTTIEPPELAQELVDSGHIHPNVTRDKVKELKAAATGATKPQTKKPPAKQSTSPIRKVMAFTAAKVPPVVRDWLSLPPAVPRRNTEGQLLALFEDLTDAEALRWTWSVLHLRDQ